MPDLVLGPVHRYVGETDATVWVETSEPCEVTILGQRERTFSVEGHHYALVVIEALEPGRTYPYEVRLDGERRWPEPGPGFPPALSARSVRAPSSTWRSVPAASRCRMSRRTR